MSIEEVKDNPQAPEVTTEITSDEPQREIEIMSNGEKLSLTKEETPEAPEPEGELEVDPAKILEETKGQIDEAKKVLSGVGLDYDAYAQEYNETGELSAETLEKLEQAGISKPLVKAYIAGLEAESNRVAEAVIKSLGGEQAFSRLGEFVKSLGDKEIDAFNRVVQAGDIQHITTVLKGYQAQMIAKYGTNNPTILGGGSASAVQGFESLAEQSKAINDPRYEKDPKYRAEVQKKMLASKFN